MGTNFECFNSFLSCFMWLLKLIWSFLSRLFTFICCCNWKTDPNRNKNKAKKPLRNTIFYEGENKLKTGFNIRKSSFENTENTKSSISQLKESSKNNYEIIVNRSIIGCKLTPKQRFRDDKNVPAQKNLSLDKKNPSKSNPPSSNLNMPQTYSSINSNQLSKINDNRLLPSTSLKTNEKKISSSISVKINANQLSNLNENKLSPTIPVILNNSRASKIEEKKISPSIPVKTNTNQLQKVEDKKLPQSIPEKTNTSQMITINRENKAPAKSIKREPERFKSPTQILYFTLFLNPPVNGKSEYLDDAYDLTISKCTQCKQNEKKIFAFLCNHNLCEDCTSLHCAYLILNFFNHYSVNPNKIFQFSYSCPVNWCGLKISMPTVFILKRVRGWLRDPWFRENYSCFVFFEDLSLDLWVPYFDGITINYMS